MIIGPPPKFHGTRDILPSVVATHLRGAITPVLLTSRLSGPCHASAKRRTEAREDRSSSATRTSTPGTPPRRPSTPPRPLRISSAACSPFETLRQASVTL